MVLKIKPKRDIAHLDLEKAIKTVTEEEMMKFTVNIPESLHTKFKLKAVSNKVGMNNLIISWIKEYVIKM